MVKELCEQELKRGTLRRKAEGSEWDTWLIMILRSVWVVWFRKMKCIRHQSWNSLKFKGGLPTQQLHHPMPSDFSSVLDSRVLVLLDRCCKRFRVFFNQWLGARCLVVYMQTILSCRAPCKTDDRMTTCGYSYSKKPPAVATKQPQSSKNM